MEDQSIASRSVNTGGESLVRPYLMQTPNEPICASQSAVCLSCGQRRLHLPLLPLPRQDNQHFSVGGSVASHGQATPIEPTPTLVMNPGSSREPQASLSSFFTLNYRDGQMAQTDNSTSNPQQYGQHPSLPADPLLQNICFMFLQFCEESDRRVEQLQVALEELEEMETEDEYMDTDEDVSGEDVDDDDSDMPMEEEEEEADGLDVNDIIADLSTELYRPPHSDTEPPCCSICLDDFTEGVVLGILNCRHKFHRICIENWLSRRNLCPLCRKIGLAI